MKSYGVFPIEQHYTKDENTGGYSFNYDGWEGENKLQLNNFITSLSSQEDNGGLGDLLSNRIIARMQSAAEMPAMKLAGEQNRLSQIKRLEEMAEEGLEMPTGMGPFRLLDYDIVHYRDRNGKIVYHNDQPLVLMKAKYGYRLVDNKKAYHDFSGCLVQVIHLLSPRVFSSHRACFCRL